MRGPRSRWRGPRRGPHPGRRPSCTSGAPPRGPMPPPRSPPQWKVGSGVSTGRRPGAPGPWRDGDRHFQPSGCGSALRASWPEETPAYDPALSTFGEDFKACTTPSSGRRSTPSRSVSASGAVGSPHDRSPTEPLRGPLAPGHPRAGTGSRFTAARPRGGRR